MLIMPYCVYFVMVLLRPGNIPVVEVLGILLGHIE